MLACSSEGTPLCSSRGMLFGGVLGTHSTTSIFDLDLILSPLIGVAGDVAEVWLRCGRKWLRVAMGVGGGFWEVYEDLSFGF